MKKKNLVLLLGLVGFMLPLSINRVASSSAIAEEEQEQVVLNYTEEIDDITGVTKRYYYDYFPAVIDEHFKAPNGCVLNLKSDLELIDKITDEVKALPEAVGINELNMVDVIVYRKLGEVGIYSESQCDWNISFENLSQFLLDKTSDLVLYELEEKTSNFEISAKIAYQFYFESCEYVFNFDVKPYEVKAYKNGDVVRARLTYFAQNSEQRISVFADINEDLFNEKYGFKTDGRTNPWGDKWYEEYTVSYFHKETNTIIGMNNNGELVEMTPVPNEPMTVYIRLSFYSGGRLYEFYSNEVVVQEKVSGLLLDGFDNRNTVGVNENHTIRINTLLEQEDLSQFSFEAYYKTGDDKIVIANHEYNNQIVPIENDPNVWRELTNDFYEFNVNFAKPGDYEIYIDFMANGESIMYFNKEQWHRTIHVVNEPITYTSVDDALTLNVGERIDCISGGDPIEICAEFAADLLNNCEIPTYEWRVSRVNVLELTVDGNKAVINPVGTGVVILTVTCTTRALGTISKDVTLNIIEDIYTISTLRVADEFHYSKNDLVVELNVKNYSKVANFKPEWKVTDKDEKEIAFIDNGDLTITIVSPLQSDYTITALYHGVEITSITVEVRDVNINLFVQQNIWWILLITLCFMGVVIALKVLLERKHSLVEMINKTVMKFSEINRLDSSAPAELKKVQRMIQLDLNYASDLNMDALNQYEKTIRYLTKSLNGIKKINNPKVHLSEEEYNVTYEKLKNDLEKAYVVIKEFEDAKDIALMNSYNANQNNYAKVDSNKKKSK